MENQTLFSFEGFNKPLYSYSRFKLFHQCKLRYKLKHIDKKKDQRTTFYLSLGRSVHHFLEIYTNSIMFNNPTEENVLRILNECWDSKGYKSLDEEKKWFERSKIMLVNFLSNKIYLRKPFIVEKEFRDYLQDFEISSRIDRIDKINENQCEIIDYKVGESEVNVDQLMDDLQWAFHYLASYKDLKQNFNLEVAKITFYFLEAKLPLVIIPQEDLIEQSKIKIIKKLNEIENETEYEPSLNKYCVDCMFDLNCPLMQEFRKKGIDIHFYLD